MVSAVMKTGRMPAYRAAFGFAPTVRISKPSVVRSRIQRITKMATIAKTMPRCTLRPSRIGSALGPMSQERGGVGQTDRGDALVCPGACLEIPRYEPVDRPCHRTGQDRERHTDDRR